MEERRRLRIFVVVTGVIYSLAVLAARLGSSQGRLMGLSATLDVLAAGISMALAALVLAAAVTGMDFGLPIRLLAAAVVAGIRMGLLNPKVDVQTHGGTLTIEWQGLAKNDLSQAVFMTGPATSVFEGEIDVPNLP